ncbi:TetR family transcriptional regulator C-terminal domain-containing protein [Tabrizicola fusiformis]|jgi:TetR/AcrR family transcriptional repressor of bet genes|uniref:TetR family transcriptional regulator C-terminal domain-containing protein n=1 Tax=Tabrizicola sp. SY72 TaxID=2741673 RepID=UPI00157290DE|nr:TetR family transcriptional regulator C-terminal domain-containing protein [Tabrizicola sp. SY72]NTT84310.1 TetR family transcriptional regulator C-terminal domain-containing protein [Tabrizicola sp. SY72]
MAAAPDQDNPPPRKLPRDARRSQLIEATIETMAQNGYARTTLTQVAKAAGLSHGLVNFHFQSKEGLLLETLLFLAEEYRQNWTEALAASGPSAPEELRALLEADFNPAICTPARLSAWCSFWGEAQSRPIYQERCGANDEEYNRRLEAICARMNAEHGYAVNPARAARVLRVVTEGVWLDMMTMTSPYDLTEAQATVMTAAAAFFPRHFTG